MANIFAGSIKSVGLRKVSSHKKEMYNRINKIVKILLRTVFLVGISFVMLYPILFIISGAFKAKIDVYDPTVVWIPKHYSLEGLFLAVETLDFWESLASTLLILIPSVLLQIVSTLLAGYGFARYKFKERNILFILLIFTIIVPVQNIIVGLYGNMQRFDMFGIFHLISLITQQPLPNLLNTKIVFWVMAAFGSGIRSGLYIFIMRQFFRNMPSELEEAAMIDGCGSFKTFTRVMLPNVIPAIVTIIVFSIVWYWNDYYQAATFLNKDMPLSVSLTNLNASLDSRAVDYFKGNMQDLMLMRNSVLECGCLLVLAPLLVMYVFLQRFFTESIERTGIVG